FLDLNLHANASGLAGVMFPHDKLTDIIDRVASDIEQHYDTVLRGDPTVWHKIEKLLAAPQEKKPYLPWSKRGEQTTEANEALARLAAEFRRSTNKMAVENHIETDKEGSIRGDR